LEHDANLDGERESLKEEFTEKGQSERECRVWQDDEAQREEATDNSVGEVERPQPQAPGDHRKQGTSEEARDKCADSPREADGACGSVEVCAEAAEQVGQSEGTAGREEQVWKVLAGTKSEFEKFGGLMERVEKNIGTVQNTLRDVGTRTRAIIRSLKDVELVDLQPVDATTLLALNDAPECELDGTKAAPSAE
jgi:cytochrome c556